MFVKPTFFDFFKCKADKCTDSCCVGWEIDVDDISYKKYCNVKGEFGDELRKSISFDGNCYSFNLDEKERCPFLNENNLCRIYMNLGEDSLCDICAEHPRFYNYVGDSEEVGFGLCCEKTCELLFDDSYNLEFSYEGKADDETTEFLEMRNKCFEIISSVTGNIFDKMKNVLSYVAEYENRYNDIDFYNNEMINKIVSAFVETEPINDEWTEYVNLLNGSLKTLQLNTVNNKNYDKLFMYIIYRHLQNAFYDGEYYSWAVFCCVNVVFVYLSDCMSDSNLNKNIIENVKRWSKQIEYSTENIEIIRKYFD